MMVATKRVTIEMSSCFRMTAQMRLTYCVGCASNGCWSSIVDWRGRRAGKGSCATYRDVRSGRVEGNRLLGASCRHVVGEELFDLLGVIAWG